jgi:tetratricopeptide (TPR) repeat protein
VNLKFEKPNNYIIVSKDNLNQLKNEILSNFQVCESSKISLQKSLLNPNYEVLVNANDYNETITLVQFPNFDVKVDISQKLKRLFEEECYSIKNAKTEYLGEDSSNCQLGNYTSYLFKVRAPEITYYSEGFFIEGSNSNFLITVNTIQRQTNTPFIQSLETISSDKYSSLINQFHNLCELEKYENSMECLSKAIDLEPSNVIAYEKRIAVNFILKKYNEVIIDAEKLIQIDEGYINGIIARGLAKYQMQDFTNAINDFEAGEIRILTNFLLNEQNHYLYSLADIYGFIGESYIKLNNAQMATDNLEDALAFSVDSLNRGSIYFHLGITKSTIENNYPEAINFYSLAIDNYPDSALKKKSEAYYNRAINQRRVLRYQEAIKDYSSAIKLRPNYFKAYNNMAVAKIAVEDFKGAITDCEYVIKFDNEKSDSKGMAYCNRGIAKLYLGDDSGCADIKKAISLGQLVPEETSDLCK